MQPNAEQSRRRRQLKKPDTRIADTDVDAHDDDVEMMDLSNHSDLIQTANGNEMEKDCASTEKAPVYCDTSNIIVDETIENESQICSSVISSTPMITSNAKRTARKTKYQPEQMEMSSRLHISVHLKMGVGMTIQNNRKTMYTSEYMQETVINSAATPETVIKENSKIFQNDAVLTEPPTTVSCPSTSTIDDIADPIDEQRQISINTESNKSISDVAAAAAENTIINCKKVSKRKLYVPPTMNEFVHIEQENESASRPLNCHSSEKIATKPDSLPQVRPTKVEKSVSKRKLHVPPTMKEYFHNEKENEIIEPSSASLNQTNNEPESLPQIRRKETEKCCTQTINKSRRTSFNFEKLNMSKHRNPASQMAENHIYYMATTAMKRSEIDFIEEVCFFLFIFSHSIFNLICSFVYRRLHVWVVSSWKAK